MNLLTPKLKSDFRYLLVGSMSGATLIMAKVPPEINNEAVQHICYEIIQIVPDMCK